MFTLLMMSFLPLALMVGIYQNNHDDDDDKSDEPERDADPESGEGASITLTGDGAATEGTSGDDTIYGTDGNDTVSGGAGEDRIWLGAGDDRGPLTEDIAVATGAMGTFGDLGAMMQTFSDEGLFGAEGGTGDDYIDGGHGDDAITGGPGNDTLRGNLGDDLLIDTRGANSMHGGYGDDQLIALDEDDSPWADVMDGSVGDDALWGDDGDTMTGGAGIDMFAINWQPGDDPVVITDMNKDVTADPTSTEYDQEALVIQVENWPEGSTFSMEQTDTGLNVLINGETAAVLEGLKLVDLNGDGVYLYDVATDTSYIPTYPGYTQIGTDGNDVLTGREGDDRLYGSLGADSLTGNEGDDTLLGGYGADTLMGNDGDDSLVGGAQNDVMDGGAGYDHLIGGAGNDMMLGGAGNDTLLGEDGNDSLSGGLGRNLIDGGAGDDIIAAGGTLDTVYGGDGNDTIVASNTLDDDLITTVDGGAGDDVIYGSDGNELTGGTGADLFATSYDTTSEAVVVLDFTPGEDMIEIIANTSATVSVTATADGLGSQILVDGLNVMVLQGVKPADVPLSAITLSAA
ncbi:calcium-binding protein [Paenirhodobacter sp. CAU 1674]|uniref:calcium-binding protein n=1 Tax=Paenirhodobacter sp. CAU 1674 TaxID=3032596 RepID=UPI0023DB8C6E|nr:calcium-binding protein [Paenirhodobacter sp. CAU 1674]MDF2140950.1 calcium-binding protein [Paenirhodobacter sp. CAU 1674]